jgi:phosphoglycolate phosphatase-like HAD superfamily hydrolase
MAPKPHPSGREDQMQTLEVSPKQCLFVGGSHRDIECAKRAGAWSGAALWASVEPELVLALNPEFRWDRLGDIGVTLKLQ